MPQSVTLRKLERLYEDLQDLLELTPKKDVLFIIGYWNAKVGSQETPGVTGKFDLGIRNEAGQKANRVLPRECTLVIQRVIQASNARMPRFNPWSGN